MALWAFHLDCSQSTKNLGFEDCLQLINPTIKHTLCGINCFQSSANLPRLNCESWGLFTVWALSVHKTSGGWRQFSESYHVSSLFPKNRDWCCLPWVGKILEGSRLSLVKLYVEPLKLCLGRRNLGQNRRLTLTGILFQSKWAIPISRLLRAKRPSALRYVECLMPLMIPERLLKSRP